MARSFSAIAAAVSDELRAVMQRVDEHEVQDLLDRLLAARRVVLVGVGREGLTARAFAMRLAHAGVDAHWVWDDTTPPVGPGDLVVAVSGSGRIPHIEAVMSNARDAGASTAVVTAAPDGVTAAAADARVFVPATAYLASGDLVASIQPMGSLFEQSTLVLFDSLILMLIAEKGLVFADLAARHRNIE